jgi:predicted nucleotidyltransferase
MSGKRKIHMPADEVAEFCKSNGIRKLSLFGSALRDDFRPDSDIDPPSQVMEDIEAVVTGFNKGGPIVLVEFRAGATPNLLDLARMERELSAVLGGRKVDLRTPQELSRYFREEVLSRQASSMQSPDRIRLQHMLEEPAFYLEDLESGKKCDKPDCLSGKNRVMRSL